MINQPTTYAPVQQPAQKFSAIEINISGATVGAPAPVPAVTQQPLPQPDSVGQNVNYTA